MKNKEKKVNKAEEAKKEVQTEEEGTQLTDDDLEQVSGGTGNPDEPYQGSTSFETGGFGL